MEYTRITMDEYAIQSNYGYGHGWEDLACYDSFREAREELKLYRENEPQYPHRLITRRVKIEA